MTTKYAIMQREFCVYNKEDKSKGYRLFSSMPLYHDATRSEANEALEELEQVQRNNGYEVEIVRHGWSVDTLVCRKGDDKTEFVVVEEGSEKPYIFSHDLRRRLEEAKDGLYMKPVCGGYWSKNPQECDCYEAGVFDIPRQQWQLFPDLQVEFYAECEKTDEQPLGIDILREDDTNEFYLSGLFEFMLEMEAKSVFEAESVSVN